MATKQTKTTAAQKPAAKKPAPKAVPSTKEVASKTKTTLAKKAPAKAVAAKEAPAKKSAATKKTAAVAKKSAAVKKAAAVAKKPDAAKKSAAVKKAAPVAKKPAVAKKSAAEKKAAAEKPIPKSVLRSVAQKKVAEEKAAKPRRKKVVKAAPVEKTPPAQAPEEVVQDESNIVEALEQNRMRFSDKTLDEFRETLSARRAGLNEKMLSLKQQALNRSERLHPTEDGTASTEIINLLRQSEQFQQMIYAIDEALRAIDDGTYGICQHCSRLIQKPRLLAMPFARHCINCAKELERARNIQTGHHPVRRPQ